MIAESSYDGFDLLATLGYFASVLETVVTIEKRLEAWHERY
jgi:hypothetical protein